MESIHRYLVTRVSWTRLGQALAAGLVLAIFLASPGINHYAPSAFGPTVYGSANKPFVYRALVPTVVRLTTGLVPQPARDWVVGLGSKPGLGSLLEIFDAIPPRYTVEFIVASALMYAALLGFLWALRYLVTGIYQASERLPHHIAWFALLLLPTFFCLTSFIYDFPTLCLFTLALALMVRERWWTYLVVFTVACFNKETTVLLTMVFALSYFGKLRLSPRRYALLLGLQVTAWLAVTRWLHWKFQFNPGQSVETHLLDHNIFLLRPYPLATGLGLAAVAFLVAFRWSDKPRFLRIALLILPVELAITVFLGYLDELRDYYEAFPVLLLLMADTVARIAGLKLQQRPAKEAAAQLGPAVAPAGDTGTSAP